MTIQHLFASASSDDAGGALIALIIVTGFVVLVWAAMWRVFTKAGEAGWQAIIPIYNIFVLMRIVGRPWWWMLLMLIPFVNFVVGVIVLNDLSKSFGKGVGFTIGLILLSVIFLFILAFGEATYRGPAGPEGQLTSAGNPPPPPTATA